MIEFSNEELQTIKSLKESGEYKELLKYLRKTLFIKVANLSDRLSTIEINEIVNYALLST